MLVIAVGGLVFLEIEENCIFKENIAENAGRNYYILNEYRLHLFFLKKLSQN